MNTKEVIQKLKNEFNENINSHIFLIETNDIEKSILEIKEIVKDIIAPNDEIIKRQIDTDNYIELITLRSEGKIIKTDAIAKLQDRIKIKPIISNYMIYMIANAEDMNESASNKLLKTIEEPNTNIIGFLFTKNADLLLPTIKSRCEILTLIFEDDSNIMEIAPETHDLTKNLIYALEKKDHILFYRLKNAEKNLKENAQTIENLIKAYYNMACKLKETKNLDIELVEYIRNNNDFKTLVKKTKYLNTLLNKLTKNMNADLLLEKIFFDLKEVK